VRICTFEQRGVPAAGVVAADDTVISTVDLLGGATDEDDLVLITLGVRGFKSAALGAVLMHDSRDNEDMPTTGWLRRAAPIDP